MEVLKNLVLELLELDLLKRYNFGIHSLREVRERAIKSDLENTASVSESSSEENTTIMVSSYEEDSEYFHTKASSKHGVHNCYINCSPTMNFIYNYIILYIILYIKLKEM